MLSNTESSDIKIFGVGNLYLHEMMCCETENSYYIFVNFSVYYLRNHLHIDDRNIFGDNQGNWIDHTIATF